jgi:hypothetical protein
MGLLDILLGRSRPAAPDLDRLFALPSAAVPLEAATGLTPTGRGAVCFATVEGAAFDQTHREVRALLDADGSPVDLSRDEYGYSWLVSRRDPDRLADLVNDLHAVNSAMEVNGFGPQLPPPRAPGARRGGRAATTRWSCGYGRRSTGSCPWSGS